MVTSTRSASAPLVSIDELTALHHHVLRRRSRRAAGAGTIMPGMQPAGGRGTGLDLMDTRSYQFGDDLRHLDWRATARCGKAMTKVFRAERERSVFIAVDRGATMAFGTIRGLKAATAARCAAILAFAAHYQRETVSGLIHDDEARFFAPSRRREQVWSLVQAAAAELPTPARQSSPSSDKPIWDARATHDGIAAAAKNSTLFFLSDFLVLNKQTSQPLRELARRRRVVAVRIWDRGELRLPRTGHLHVVDASGQHELRIDTRAPGLHAEFARKVQGRYDEIQSLLRDCGAVTLAVNSEMDPLNVLEPWI